MEPEIHENDFIIGKIQQTADSGNIFDRIDIQIEVVPVPFQDRRLDSNYETSQVIQSRVLAARKIQQDRFSDSPGIHNNAQISPSLMIRHCQPDAAGAALLKNAMESLGLSARAYDRILKVARTIADLNDSSKVQAGHLAEAINYRSLDREGWGG